MQRMLAGKPQFFRFHPKFEVMKMDKITYQKAFAIGPYLQEKIGVEIQLDVNDNEDEAIKLAKETVERWKSNTTSVMMMNSDTGLREVVEVSRNTAEQDSVINQAFEALKKVLEDAPNKNMAQQLLQNSEFKHNIELKELIKNKQTC